MKKKYLVTLIALALVIKVNAQSALSTDYKNEYAAGVVLFWEGNLGTIGLGLHQEYRRHLTDKLNLSFLVSDLKNEK